MRIYGASNSSPFSYYHTMNLENALIVAVLTVLTLMATALYAFHVPSAKLSMGALGVGITAAVCVSIGVAVHAGQL